MIIDKKPTYKVLTTEEKVERLEYLAQGGTYYKGCYLTPGVTPRNLATIVGHNLIRDDRIDDLKTTRQKMHKRPKKTQPSVPIKKKH